MFFILFGFLIAADSVDPNWSYRVHVHEPFFLETGNRLIAVSDRGEIFFINNHNLKLAKVNASGKTEGVIARKGWAPGELDYPLHMEVRGELLFVKDVGKNCISIWNTDGTFVKEYPTDGHAFSLAMGSVTDGVVLADWDYSEDPQKPVSLTLFNTNMEKQKVLWHTRRLSDIGGSVTRVPNRVLKFNPAKDQYFLAAGKDGKTLFISEPGDSLKITVVDAVSGNVIKTISRVIPRQPYDRVWAKKEMRLWQAHTLEEDTPIKMTIEEDFGDVFPLVRSMFVAADGRMAVSLWTDRPDQKRAYLIFDDRGEESPSSLSMAALDRVIGFTGDAAIVTTFDNVNDEAGFASIPRAAVNRFVEKNPLGYDGSQLPFNLFVVP